jgi:hypothetical protein
LLGEEEREEREERKRRCIRIWKNKIKNRVICRKEKLHHLPMYGLACVGGANDVRHGDS